MNRFTFEAKDLSSRSNAAELRTTISQIVNDGESVVLDFSTVESLSDSYADELFGVLAVYVGLETLTSKVIIKDAKDNIYLKIASNIQNRLQSQAQSAA